MQQNGKLIACNLDNDYTARMGKHFSSYLSMPAWSVLSLAFSLIMLILIYCQGRGAIEGVDLCQFISLIAFLSYILFLSALYTYSKKIDFLLLLVLLSWPFYFGQQFLEAFDIPTVRRMLSIGQLSSDGLFEASFFTLLAMNTLCLAYVAAPRKLRTNILSAHKARESRESLRKAALVIAVLSIIPTLVTLYRNYMLSLTYGYGGRIVDSDLQLSGIDNIFGIIAEFMPYSLLGLILTKKERERWPVIALIIYLLLYMLSGSRTQGFILLVSLAFVWSSLLSKKTPARQLLSIGIGILIVATLFSTISIARTFISDGNVSNGVSGLIQNTNPLIDAIQEAGQTIVVLGSVIEHTPYPITYANGTTFLAGLSYVLPNGLTGNYFASVPSVDEMFQKYLTASGGVGSSFIAEAYYNFGTLSLGLIVLYGFLLGRLQNRFDLAVIEGRYYTAFICVACFAICSFYIRSDVRTFLRNFIWKASPVVVVEWVIRRSKDMRRPSRVDES